MSMESTIALVVSLAVLSYLLVAMVWPEKF